MSDETATKTRRPYVRRPKALAPAAPVVPDHSAAILEALARIVEGQAKVAALGGGSLDANALGASLAAALEKDRVARLPSNPDATYVPSSVFEPHGLDGKPLPKAFFVREIYVNNSPERRDSLRPDEVDAYNLLSASLPNPGNVRRAHSGKWVARVNDEGNKLFITFPCKGVDDQLNGPKGILALCKELTDGTEVPSVDGMLAQMVKLQAQNAQIMALLAKRPELAAELAGAVA